jgi:hypothetical protein
MREGATDERDEAAQVRGAYGGSRDDDLQVIKGPVEA